MLQENIQRTYPREVLCLLEITTIGDKRRKFTTGKSIVNNLIEEIMQLQANSIAIETAFKRIDELERELAIVRINAERYRKEANNISELSQKNLDKYFTAKEELKRTVERCKKVNHGDFNLEFISFFED